MKEIRNVLVIGLGAIGSIYATKFFDYDNACVKVLLDKSRLERYIEDGIIFNNQRYDFEYVLEYDRFYKPDLIIIATKGTDFKQSSRMIRSFVSEDTIIMSLLNGISTEEILMEKYGADKVLYSYYLGHASMRRGNRIKFDGEGNIFFGEKDNTELSENVAAVKRFFDRCGISYKIPQDMISSLWQKFIINIGANQTLAMLKEPYSAFKDLLHARNTAFALMSEAVEIAKALNIKDADNFVENAFETLCYMPPHLKPSMLQDIENGNLTEVDFFAGEVCRLGKKLGIQTPKNSLAYNIIKSLEQASINSYASVEVMQP
ncbi:MAG: ketopantoate reductase family protein [bacterium]|nr:ketopantoate reductase family protein [bacterium]